MSVKQWRKLSQKEIDFKTYWTVTWFYEDTWDKQTKEFYGSKKEAESFIKELQKKSYVIEILLERTSTLYNYYKNEDVVDANVQVSTEQK